MKGADINLDTPRTGTPSEEYKTGWDRIFGPKYQDPKLCGSCGVDLNKGMCRGCKQAMGVPKHDVKKTVGDW